MTEHPVQQAIKYLAVSKTENGDDNEYYMIGKNGITRIEATIKSGEYSHIPYVRVWKGDYAFAEFCQHKVVGVYFEPSGSAK